MTSILKDTNREKAPSNKTPTLSKSMNKDIWVAGTSNHSLYEVPKPKQNIPTTKVVTGKTPFFVICLSCTPHSICLNIGF